MFCMIRLLRCSLSAVVTPFSTLLYARMGNGIATNQLMKMVAGAVNPGRPVANLYVSSRPQSFVDLSDMSGFTSSQCGAMMSLRLQST